MNKHEDYQNILSENVCNMYGYTQAMIRGIAHRLRMGHINPNEAARNLIALDRTMERLFEKRGEKGACDNINQYYDEFKASMIHKEMLEQQKNSVLEEEG